MTGAKGPYATLLERIILGDYPPGTNLSEREITAELGVSRTPVREAMLRLQLEGMVRIIARGGIFVAEASIQQIREITEVRLTLEECSGRLAVERCPESLVDEFVTWLAKLERDWEQLSPRQRMLEDLRFHDMMDRAAGNRVLASQLTILRNQSVLFWGQSNQYSLEMIIDDYRGVVTAIANKDAIHCVHMLHQHVLKHIEHIQEYLRPDPVELSITYDRTE